jgi:hypothetical protein
VALRTRLDGLDGLDDAGSNLGGVDNFGIVDEELPRRSSCAEALLAQIDV